MTSYKIAILVGSLRKDSLNRRVAKSICAIRGDNLDCRMIEIGDLPLYNQDLDQDPPEQWVRFREQVGAADGVLFVSPEYNRGRFPQPSRSPAARRPSAWRGRDSC